MLLHCSFSFKDVIYRYFHFLNELPFYYIDWELEVIPCMTKCIYWVNIDFYIVWMISWPAKEKRENDFPIKYEWSFSSLICLLSIEKSRTTNFHTEIFTFSHNFLFFIFFIVVDLSEMNCESGVEYFVQVFGIPNKLSSSFIYCNSWLENFPIIL